jgi:hypothetical protein
MSQSKSPCADFVSRSLCKITGLTKVLGAFLLLAALSTTARAANVTLAWSASTNSNIAGYIVYYGEASQTYTSSVNVGSNLSETISALTPGLTYYFSALAYDTNGDDSGFSNEATNTIPLSLAILTQPMSETVIAGAAASLTSANSGAAPLFIQWYFGSTAIQGATNAALTWASVAASNAGNYYFTISNMTGAVTSSVATLTILSTNTIAAVAGVYNGLFYQTNANGTPAITEATAGFLGNCVVASNGLYSAKLCLGGVSYSLAGTFNTSGTATATVPLTGAGSHSVKVVLQLDLSNNTRQITGAVSSTNTGNAWTATVLGDLATNAFPMLTGASLLFSPGTSTNSPTNNGVATGLMANSILSLSGVLGDTATFSQTVQISKDGNVPIYINLYTNGGVLEGWINLDSGSPIGNLTWIRPSGVLKPTGFPQGFDTLVQVSGTTYQQAVGLMGTSGPGTYSFAYTTASTSGWIVFQDSNGNQYFRATGANFSFNATGSLTFWSCVGTNNPTPSGVITALVATASGNNPTLTSMNIGGLPGLQTFMIENQGSIASINASDCPSLTSLSCNGITVGTIINASNSMSLTSLSMLTSFATVVVQNEIIATLPTFTAGTHTLYWSEYAPTNLAGDAAAAAKGWIVNRKTS